MKNYCRVCDQPLDARNIIFTKFQYVYAKCGNCTMVQVVNTPSEDESAAFEAETEFNIAEEVVKHKKGDFDHIGTQSWAYRQRLQELVLLTPNTPVGVTKSLLEIGSATGIFLHLAQAYGWDVEGVELNQQACQIAEQAFGLKMHNVPVEQSDLGRDAFDVIVMQEVLEHIPNPGRTLDILLTYLKRGGIILISCPNIDSVLVRVFGKNARHFCPPQHKNHFNIASLSYLFEQRGCDLIRARTEHEPDHWTLNHFSGDSLLVDPTEQIDKHERTQWQRLFEYARYVLLIPVRRLTRRIVRPYRFWFERHAAVKANGRMEGSYLVAYFRKN